MHYYLAIDGGGTKTHLALANANGNIIAMQKTSTCHLSQVEGIEALEILFTNAIDALLSPHALTLDNIKTVCIGFPGYGAFPESEKALRALFNKLFGINHYTCYNDVHIAWAANHLGGEGIHVVSGTGAIAYGRSITQKQITTGGWGPVLGDEGSGFWLGLKAISLFCKQVDGRLPKDAFYDAFKKSAGLLTDYDIIERVKNPKGSDRAYIASFSKPFYEACEYNPYAMAAFIEAGKELAELCFPIAHRLNLYRSDQISVSGSGSILENCPIVWDSFKKTLETKDARFQCLPMTTTPIHGAIRLAIKK